MVHWVCLGKDATHVSGDRSPTIEIRGCLMHALPIACKKDDVPCFECEVWLRVCKNLCASPYGDDGGAFILLT